MAKATTIPARPPVTLELSAEEASELFALLVNEKWPIAESRGITLNDIYEALGAAGVEMPD
jgi:hypothetical protein